MVDQSAIKLHPLAQNILDILLAHNGQINLLEKLLSRGVNGCGLLQFFEFSHAFLDNLV